MFFTTTFITIVAAATSVSAFTGAAQLEGRQPSTPCPVTPACPLTDFRVIVPADKFPGSAKCCDTVSITYNGQNLDATLTDLCFTCNGTEDISLSVGTFQKLARPEVGVISPVVWNVLG